VRHDLLLLRVGAVGDVAVVGVGVAQQPLAELDLVRLAGDRQRLFPVRHAADAVAPLEDGGARAVVRAPPRNLARVRRHLDAEEARKDEEELGHLPGGDMARRHRLHPRHVVLERVGAAVKEVVEVGLGDRLVLTPQDRLDLQQRLRLSELALERVDVVPRAARALRPHRALLEGLLEPARLLARLLGAAAVEVCLADLALVGLLPLAELGHRRLQRLDLVEQPADARPAQDLELVLERRDRALQRGGGLARLVGAGLRLARAPPLLVYHRVGVRLDLLPVPPEPQLVIDLRSPRRRRRLSAHLCDLALARGLLLGAELVRHLLGPLALGRDCLLHGRRSGRRRAAVAVAEVRDGAREEAALVVDLALLPRREPPQLDDLRRRRRAPPAHRRGDEPERVHVEETHGARGAEPLVRPHREREELEVGGDLCCCGGAAAAAAAARVGRGRGHRGEGEARRRLELEQAHRPLGLGEGVAVALGR